MPSQRSYISSSNGGIHIHNDSSSNNISSSSDSIHICTDNLTTNSCSISISSSGSICMCSDNLAGNSSTWYCIELYSKSNQIKSMSQTMVDLFGTIFALIEGTACDTENRVDSDVSGKEQKHENLIHFCTAPFLSPLLLLLQYFWIIIH